MSNNKTELFNNCVELARDIFAKKGFTLDPTVQVKNIFNYAATDKNFAQVLASSDPKVLAEISSQIKFICELGLDSAKGRKLVYIKTRGVNCGTRDNPIWVTFPDITISYHALIHVLIRSKAINRITVIHAYQNYEIEYSGNIKDVPIVKSWATRPGSRGEYTGAFVVLTFPNDETATSFYHFADIISTHRNFSKSSKTWKDHEQSMTAKSAIMEAIRYIPIFDETIAAVVENYDESHDWGSDEKSYSPVQMATFKDLVEQQNASGFYVFKHSLCPDGEVSDSTELYLSIERDYLATVTRGGKGKARELFTSLYEKGESIIADMMTVIASSDDEVELQEILTEISHEERDYLMKHLPMALDAKFKISA